MPNSVALPAMPSSPTAKEVLGRRDRILSLRARGASSADIAAALGCSEAVARRAIRDALDGHMPSTESAAWVSELPYRLAVAILRAGFTSQEQLRDAIRAGRLNQYTHADIGKRSWEVICAWLGLDPKLQ